MTTKTRGAPPRIGISACFFHADPQRAIFKGKTLLYMVEPISDWLLTEGVLPILIPTLPTTSKLTLREYVAGLDALLLQGGADVAPQSYGEAPLRPEWGGDAVRDAYEIALVKEFRSQDKPILAICRGLQLLNVALGGTLYQDITLQVPGALVHRNWDIYDQNIHDVTFAPDSHLAKIYAGKASHRINSVHHQGVKDLAPGLKVEARSAPDGIVEAVKWDGREYMLGVQWHPEFQSPLDKEPLLDPKPLLSTFLSEVRNRHPS